MSTSELSLHVVAKIPAIAIEQVYMLAGFLVLGCLALAVGVTIWAHHQNKASFNRRRGQSQATSSRARSV